jgi:hypothetical protein
MIEVVWGILFYAIFKISISSEGNPGGTARLKNSAWPSNAWGFSLGFSYWCQNA